MSYYDVYIFGRIYHEVNGHRKQENMYIMYWKTSILHHDVHSNVCAWICGEGGG